MHEVIGRGRRENYAQTLMLRKTNTYMLGASTDSRYCQRYGIGSGHGKLWNKWPMGSLRCRFDDTFYRKIDALGARPREQIIAFSGLGLDILGSDKLGFMGDYPFKNRCLRFSHFVFGKVSC